MLADYEDRDAWLDKVIVNIAKTGILLHLTVQSLSIMKISQRELITQNQEIQTRHQARRPAVLKYTACG